MKCPFPRSPSLQYDLESLLGPELVADLLHQASSQPLQDLGDALWALHAVSVYLLHASLVSEVV